MPSPGCKAVFLLSHSLNSSAFCSVPLLFQTFMSEFLQELSFLSNLMNMFISFFATITVFVPILTLCVLFYFFHVCFYSTWTNSQKETCNVFHIFFLFPFLIHQFFYNSLHISYYKHVAIKKQKLLSKEKSS